MIEEAERYLREALEGNRRVLGDDHQHTLISIIGIGVLIHAQEKFDEAEALLAPAIEAARRVLHREHWVTGVLIHRHGASLTALDRHTEAEVELLEAYEILSAAVGADHNGTQLVVRDLVELYETWGKPDMAAEWRAKLESPSR